MVKPSRSDEVLEADQQLRIANQIRALFDSMAPKRPIKPNRSETDSTTTPTQLSSSFDEEIIPEVNTFRSLQSQSHPHLAPIYSADGVSMVQDEFVETKYYKELNSIDKQHHTTGNGFIGVVREGGGDEYGLRMQTEHDEAAREMRTMDFKSNPARNDWIPSVDGYEYLI